MVWSRFFLVHCFIVFVRSEVESENHEEPTATASAFCNTECNQQLQNRLETIEAAIRTIVSAVSGQTDELFDPIKEIFQQDPSVRSILSLNFTSIIESSGNTTLKINSVPLAQENSHGNQPNTTAVDNLKGAVKCSLAHLVDINTIDYFKSTLNSSTDAVVVASLTNESLEITWPIFSAECIKFSSGVWIRVYQQAPEVDYKLQPETSLYVPQKCIKKKSKSSYSIILSPSSSKGKTQSCAFYLTKHLIQCRAYVVEIIPNFQSLRGKTLRTEIVVPPKMKKNDEADFRSLISVAAQNNSLMLNWEDNSGCAPQLTSFALKIFQDGIVDEVEGPNMTVTIPRSCLRRSTNEENLFSLVLPAKPAYQLTCPIEWKPLDRCRKYRIDMNSQYSSTWNGPSSSWEIFTGQGLSNYSTDVNDITWRCPKKYFYCHYHRHNYECLSSDHSWVCSGGIECSHRRDEEYCDQSVCNKDGFRCGRQCVPKELVCDGKHDCLDGSDEDGCNTNAKCEQLTNPSGHFSSEIFSKPADEIHKERISDAVRKTIVLISVQSNHQIWLTFDKFTTVINRDFLRVYDGPYSTSPLLLSHSGPTKPPSVRSSSNELFVEFPSHYDMDYKVEGSYTSVNSTDESFKPGCGGYLNGEGTISTPNYLSDNDIADCYWLIGTRQSDDLILLRRNQSDVKHPTAAFFSSRAYPEMIVYDGWSTDGLVLYDTKSTETQQKTVIYSVSNKMMVHFKPPKIKENHISYWDVFKISTPQCKNYLEGTSGTIKSPNYPMLYPHLTDCRWTISVKPGSKVRLLFAFFQTQQGADFISVYDGQTINEKLLLSESGSVPTPFVVNSSTNQVLVRFTSDGDTSLSGFLAVYSSL